MWAGSLKICVVEFERSDYVSNLNDSQKEVVSDFLKKIKGILFVFFADDHFDRKKIEKEWPENPIYWFELSSNIRTRIGINIRFGTNWLKKNYILELLSDDTEGEPDPVLEKLRKFRDENVERLLQSSLNELPLSAFKSLNYLSCYSCDDAFDMISLIIKNTENGLPEYLQRDEKIVSEEEWQTVLNRLRELNFLP